MPGDLGRIPHRIQPDDHATVGMPDHDVRRRFMKSGENFMKRLDTLRR